MNYYNNDVIIAQSTPVGSSAIALIRVSGLDLKVFLSLIFKSKKIKPRYSYTVEFTGFESKEVIDTCLIVYYQAPASFTGEDILEISCHGNNLIVEKIINEFIARGVRIAYPGEFSYRAFQNNKIDLIQAESIAEKIALNSGAYGVALQNMENGTVSKQFISLKESVLKTLSIIEHELDFSEDEITHLGVESIKVDFINIEKILNKILKSYSLIKKVNQGYKVVILGVPNAGKSTLFNTILGVDKSIVTHIEGTTRDVLESKIILKNIPFTFYDTAGYRKTTDVIEGLGIKRGLKRVESADVVLILDEKNPKKIMAHLIKEKIINQKQKMLCIKTKCDNLKQGVMFQGEEIRLAAKNNIGTGLLLTHLLTLVDSGVDQSTYNNVAVCNERQSLLVKRAKDKVKDVLVELNSGYSMDILASSCRDFVEIIEELLGQITSNDVLNNIFKGFCVGK
jgi:tRNA modification GTPase